MYPVEKYKKTLLVDLLLLRQTDRQTDRQKTDKQTKDRQIDRQKKDRQIDRQKQTDPYTDVHTRTRTCAHT